MWRWILGIFAAIVLLLVGTCWFGYRKIAGGGNTATVTVAASPELVWSYFTEPDSILVRQDSNSTVVISSDSTLQVGDSIRMEGSAGSTSSSMIWVLDRIEAPRLLEWVARDDSLGYEIVRRTDSLVAQGDSVRIVSVFRSPLLDSARTADSVSGIGSALMGGIGNIATGGMRLVGEHELKQLKARIEGTP